MDSVQYVQYHEYEYKTRLTFVADAAVVIYLVYADAVTGAGVGLTFIDLSLTMCSVIAWDGGLVHKSR